MPLDSAKARYGLIEKVAAIIGMTDIEAAIAIIKIAVNNMSLAVRGVSVERGYDPRDFVLLAFGGAGPLHAVEVARELHIPRVIIPNYPGHFSALGMLMADVRHDYIRTYYKPLEQTDFGEIKTIYEDLIAKGQQTLASEAVRSEDTVFQRYLDIRYAGQEFALSVPINQLEMERGDGAGIRQAFDLLHERQFTYHAADQPVEIVNVRLIAVGKRRPIQLPKVQVKGSKTVPVGRRPVYLHNPTPLECSIYQRDRLPAGYRITGPAVIQEYASTTLLFPGDNAEVAATGELIIDVKETANG
jgi:N-methylhydantoinase A